MNQHNPSLSATILADSVSPAGVRITTFGLKFPRFLLAELNTHRVFSRNAGSSRAVPVATINKTIRKDRAIPVYWGSNQAGMTAAKELTGLRLAASKIVWSTAVWASTSLAMIAGKLGLHKQLANRISESLSNINVIVTSTEWSNFFELRNHPDAQPEIQYLAQMMYTAMEKSSPLPLLAGQWHIPFFDLLPDGDYVLSGTEEVHTVQEALMISASLAAQYSYRKGDASLAKANDVYNRLIKSEPRHSSPFEHQALCFDESSIHVFNPDNWPRGVTHLSRDLSLWSGNFRGWIQHRNLLD